MNGTFKILLLVHSHNFVINTNIYGKNLSQRLTRRMHVFGQEINATLISICLNHYSVPL
jgi:hypothetical protein